MPLSRIESVSRDDNRGRRKRCCLLLGRTATLDGVGAKCSPKARAQAASTAVSMVVRAVSSHSGSFRAEWWSPSESPFIARKQGRRDRNGSEFERSPAIQPCGFCESCAMNAMLDIDQTG